MTRSHPLIGTTVGGRFRVTELIGEGAMAYVLRAEQDAEPKSVALKVMRPELGVEPTFPKRFRREAKAASLLAHENVVHIIDFGTDGETHYMAMELLPGRDLFDLLAREVRLTEARAANILAQVCDALAMAHGEGIIHRDLKPENIWMVREADGSGQLDKVKVLDFGIAKLLETDPSPNSSSRDGSPSSNMLTMAGTVVGTPEYMSPEQCNAAPVGPRSDVYACGVMLYQLVVGKPPFVAESPVEITIKHVHDLPDPPHHRRPGLNPALEQVIMSCLEKSPDARPKSAAFLRDTLVALAPQLSQAAPPSMSAPSSMETAPTMANLPPAVPRSARANPFDRTLASEGTPTELAMPAVVKPPPPGPPPPANRPAAAPSTTLPTSPPGPLVAEPPVPQEGRLRNLATEEARRLEAQPRTRRHPTTKRNDMLLWVAAAVIIALSIVVVVAVRMR